ncbi:hypothetical protein F442_10403 [Phytophthora nicotianae P10297]|uniref:Tf2-1-like SH3-like domain-containing protein n=1 Tax=Phytophthora nicotianae P10297 TaxID=1317064 RepID=W2Z6Y8_PHYNI|nr:hypothetical protein F442_10403 [Phytophthora nicotianae P10297]
MAEHYNKNRRQQTFKRGDEVMLSGEYLSVRHLGTTKKKFGARWVGPFEVTKCIGRGHYQLRLPPGVRIHPIFHTSIMKPYITAEYRRQNQKLFKGTSTAIMNVARNIAERRECHGIFKMKAEIDAGTASSSTSA